MKKIVTIILVILLLSIYSSFVFAASTPISLTGDSTAKPNETKTLTMQISSEKLIGVVSGKIVCSDNVKIESVTAKNNWVLTYNEETKAFSILKAEGSMTDTILEIKYTTGASEGDATITITELQTAGTDYQEESLDNLVATIKVQAEKPELTSIEITKAPSKTQYKAGEKFDSTGLQITAKYSNGTTKDITSNITIESTELKAGDSVVEIKYTENGVTKSVQQTITVNAVTNNNKNNNTNNSNNTANNASNANNSSTKNNTKKNTDNSSAKSKLPQTGVDSTIMFLIPCLIIIAIVSYSKHKKYKEI